MRWWWYLCKLMTGRRRHWSCGFCLLYHHGLQCIDPPSHLFCMSLLPLIHWWVMGSGLNSAPTVFRLQVLPFLLQHSCFIRCHKFKVASSSPAMKLFLFRPLGSSATSSWPSVCNKASLEECVFVDFKLLFRWGLWTVTYVKAEL
jgi:hypothetical protein